MLTYALVDRGTVVITGLDQQTNDKAWFQGQYYSDKLPGFSLLATVPYAVAKGCFDCRAILSTSRLSLTGPRTTGSHWVLPDCSQPGRLSSSWSGARAGLFYQEGRA